MDRKHIDFVVKLEDGKRTFDVPIQVKSSNRGKRKFEKMCKRIGVFIPVIVVFPGSEIWQLVADLTKSIKQVILSMKRRVEKTIFLERLREINRIRKEKQKRRRSAERNRNLCFRSQPAFF